MSHGLKTLQRGCMVAEGEQLFHREVSCIESFVKNRRANQFLTRSEKYLRYLNSLYENSKRSLVTVVAILWYGRTFQSKPFVALCDGGSGFSLDGAGIVRVREKYPQIHSFRVKLRRQSGVGYISKELSRPFSRRRTIHV